jgi:5-methylcytosine-specific restriction endonuclease McrA
VLSRGKNERVLSVRTFTDKDKRTAYERQNGICPICGEKHPIENMDGDHILEWSKGGRTTIDNLQMVCKSCHKELTKRM